VFLNIPGLRNKVSRAPARPLIRTMRGVGYVLKD
jgi:DNA-binding response OmpR family regulator